MTDAGMDADCIHGLVWYECPDCPVEPTCEMCDQPVTREVRADTGWLLGRLCDEHAFEVELLKRAQEWRERQ